MKLTARRTPDIAMSHYLKTISKDVAVSLKDDLMGTHLADMSEIWEDRLKWGYKFSAVPKNIDEIRKILGIQDNHRVIVAPVYSGEWSRIHKDAIGVDFAKNALLRHPNENRIRADLRQLPFSDGFADHIVSYEPTPLHAGTATPADVLKTLREFIRVADNVHIIQRATRNTPLWSSPFLMKYLSALGIPVQVKDITKHVRVVGRRNYRVISVSIDGRAARQRMQEIEKDIKAMERLVRDIKSGAPVHHALREALQSATPALKTALLERYLGQRLRSKTTPLRQTKDL